MMKEMREAVVMTVVALLAVALIALIAACGGSSSASDDTTSGGGGEVAEHVEGDEHGEQAEMFVDPAAEERLITMRTENFKFVPETVTVKVGETIRLRLENHDPVLHDYTTDEAEFIVLDESGANHDDHEDAMATGDDDQDMDPEAQVSLEPLHIAAEGNDHGELVFEATEAGEYEFYCSVPGHREAGMVGKIIIVE